MWSYAGWHSVNDYNNMYVIDDWNNVNPRHAATVCLYDFVSATTIDTDYLNDRAIIEIDGAKVGTINMSGSGRLKISSGTVNTINAKDYTIVEFHDGDINDLSIIQGATLIVFGHEFAIDYTTLIGKWTDGKPFSVCCIDNSDNVILIYSVSGVTGDFNNDKVINIKDFAYAENTNELFILSKNWLKTY